MCTAERVFLVLGAGAWVAGLGCLVAVLADLVAVHLVVQVSTCGVISLAVAALLFSRARDLRW